MTMLASLAMDYLGSPAAVAGFGATTLVLLGATVYLSKSSTEGKAAGGRNKAGSANGSHENDAKEERKKLDRSKYPGGRLTIYYGSQTGTAQMFAK